MQHEAGQGFHKGSGNGSANPEVTGQAAPGLQAQPPKNEPRPAPKRYELTEDQVRTLVQHAFEGGVSSVHTAYHLDDELECVLAALEPMPGLPAAISEGALLPWAAELVEVLGRPNFTCGSIAELLRFDGADIPRKAEHEQARVIHWLLNHYLQHGQAWRMLAEAELVRIGELARERKRNGLCGDGGPHQWPAGADLCVRCRAPKPEGSSHA